MTSNYYGCQAARNLGIRPDTPTWQESVTTRPEYELVGFCSSPQCAGHNKNLGKNGIEVMRIKRSRQRRVAPTHCPNCGWVLHWKSKRVMVEEGTAAA